MFAFANWHSICPAWRSMFSFSSFFAKLHFTRHTWQSMFSFSLFLQNGTSPGILDKDDKVCSLLACFFMLHFVPSQAFPTPLLGTMRNTRTPFDAPHSWEPWETPKNPSHASFLAFQTIPTTLLGTMRNTHPRFHALFLTTILGNHEKHPNPFSCFIFCIPKPFPPHSWEP